MKRLLKKLFLPNKIVGFLSFNLGFILLIYVFSCHLENTFIAYISYLLSTYALIIFCLWFYKICKFSNNFIKNSQLYNLYQTKELLVTKIFLAFSLLLNFIYGIFELGIGIYYKSWWFITFAVYYLILCVMKIVIIKDIKNEVGINLQNEYQKLKLIGISLLFFNLVLTGMIILIIKQNQAITYEGFIIYIVAMYDFYLIISAFIKVIKYKKEKSPLIISIKCLNFTVAMISMISLEVAMVSEFGSNDSEFKMITTSIMGFVICIINTIMSLYMIIKAHKKLKIINKK